MLKEMIVDIESAQIKERNQIINNPNDNGILISGGIILDSTPALNIANTATSLGIPSLRRNTVTTYNNDGKQSADKKDNNDGLSEPLLQFDGQNNT